MKTLATVKGFGTVSEVEYTAIAEVIYEGTHQWGFFQAICHQCLPRSSSPNLPLEHSKLMHE